MPNAKAERIEAHIYGTLILALIFQTSFYLNLEKYNAQRSNKQISLLKAARFFSKYGWLFTDTQYDETDQDKLMEILAYHLVYETRKREAYPEIVNNINENHYQ